MSEQDTIAVIGAGVIGAAVAFALAREGRGVLLLDRAEPGVAGASFGNVGHIAAELVQPLPSPGLLFGFWRELFCFGGALDLPARQALRMLPWIRRFAAAAFRRAENTRQLAPLVLPAAAAWARWLEEIGRPDLLRRHGHYEIGFGSRARGLMHTQARAMAHLGIDTQPVPAEQLLPLQRAARAQMAAGLWFPNSAHVIDPLEAVRAFAAAAVARTAAFRRFEVRSLVSIGDKIEILGDQPPLRVDAAVVCAGMGSEPLLASFGLRAPLQSVRGYHVELPGQPAFLDAPVVYTGAHVLVTPMAGRLRASSYMEFAAPDAPQMDFVFTVCDNAAAEVCPVWPGQPMTAHWGVADPAAVQGTPEQVERAFRDAFMILDRRISLFLSLPLSTLGQLAIKKEIDRIGLQ